GRTDSEVILIVGSCVFGAGILFGATRGFVSGYAHLQENQFASIPTLIERCLEDGVRLGPRVGAVCSDGRNSRATGRGACSHHGGVSRWKHRETQTRTASECRVIAERIRW